MWLTIKGTFNLDMKCTEMICLKGQKIYYTLYKVCESNAFTINNIPLNEYMLDHNAICSYARPMKIINEQSAKSVAWYLLHKKKITRM